MMVVVLFGVRVVSVRAFDLGAHAFRTGSGLLRACPPAPPQTHDVYVVGSFVGTMSFVPAPAHGQLQPPALRALKAELPGWRPVRPNDENARGVAGVRSRGRTTHRVARAFDDHKGARRKNAHYADVAGEDTHAQRRGFQPRGEHNRPRAARIPRDHEFVRVHDAASRRVPACGAAIRVTNGPGPEKSYDACSLLRGHRGPFVSCQTSFYSTCEKNRIPHTHTRLLRRVLSSFNAILILIHTHTHTHTHTRTHTHTHTHTRTHTHSKKRSNVEDIALRGDMGLWTTDSRFAMHWRPPDRR
jgi:hypothetical protein